MVLECFFGFLGVFGRFLGANEHHGRARTNTDLWEARTRFFLKMKEVFGWVLGVFEEGRHGVMGP